jgi:hypothetical protein
MYSGRIIVASDAATIGSSCVQHLQAAANVRFKFWTYDDSLHVIPSFTCDITRKL